MLDCSEEVTLYTIKAQFQRFLDVDLTELIGATGVYVIWDAKAKARPTYIGEGSILKRFADHCSRDGRRFAHPWDGYVAIVTGSTRNVHKGESEAIERLLLDVAGATDRGPTTNAHPGKASAVLHYCSSELLRIAVTGMDPLLKPSESRPLRRAKEIKAWTTGDGRYEFAYDWRARRRRAPIA